MKRQHVFHACYFLFGEEALQFQGQELKCSRGKIAEQEVSCCTYALKRKR